MKFIGLALTITLMGVSGVLLSAANDSNRTKRVVTTPPLQTTPSDIPDGAKATIKQLSALLDAGEYEDAVRLCWEPSMLVQMDQAKVFEKVVVLVKQDKNKTIASLKHAILVGSTKALTNEEGRQYLCFNDHNDEFVSFKLTCVNKHWYMW